MSSQTKIRSLFSKLGLTPKRPSIGSGRKLRFEQCEDRRMLAPILVDTHLDTSGGGSTSLRDAIIQAEASSAPDEITFAPSVDGESILLTQGALPTITHSLSIDTQGQDITVDASGNGGGSVFVINTDVPFGALPDLDYIIAGLTITGGDASHGGGIYFRGISGNFFPSANPEDYRD